MIRIYGNIVPSEVDGPGVRAVVHFAGCSVGCAGCFNPHTHAPTGENVRAVSVDALADEILAVSRAVTVSGGEPTDQPNGLVALLEALRSRGCDDIVMFTGRRTEWLLTHRKQMWIEICRDLLVDVVIDGPFIKAKLEQDAVMRGSSNQRVICLTDRWTEDDFKCRETQVEIIDGRVVVTGFPAEDLRDMLSLLGSTL